MAKKTTVQDNEDYIVLLPTTKTGKHVIAARRVGSEDRYTPLIECRSESIALKIVKGLRMVQREEVKIDTMSQHLISELRASLASERGKAQTAQSETSSLRERLRNAERETDRVAQERNILQAKLNNLMKAREDA